MQRFVALDNPEFRRAVAVSLARSPELSSRELFAELRKQFRWLTDLHLRSFQRRLQSWNLNQLLGELRNTRRLQIVLGVREANWSRRRDLHEGFDVETAAELGGLIPPERKGSVAWRRIATQDWDFFEDLLRDRNTSFLSVGSPVSNCFTAFLLAKMFELDGQRRPPPSDWPFWFCWPHRTEKHSFERLPNESPGAVVKSGAYLFGWKQQVFYIEQSAALGEASQDYGLVVARRTRTNSLLVCLLGASGPGTLAAARVLVSGKIELTVPAYRDRTVLCAPVVARVFWDSDRSRADNRICGNARLLADPCYLPCY